MLCWVLNLSAATHAARSVMEWLRCVEQQRSALASDCGAWCVVRGAWCVVRGALSLGRFVNICQVLSVSHPDCDSTNVPLPRAVLNT